MTTAPTGKSFREWLPLTGAMSHRSQDPCDLWVVSYIIMLIEYVIIEQNVDGLKFIKLTSLSPCSHAPNLYVTESGH